MMSEKELSNIDQFSREEYNLQKFHIQVVLPKKHLYKIIYGTTICTLENVIEYAKKNSQALAIQCAMINKKILQQLVNYKTTKEVWKKIKMLHTRKATQNVHYFHEKFYNL